MVFVQEQKEGVPVAGGLNKCLIGVMRMAFVANFLDSISIQCHRDAAQSLQGQPPGVPGADAVAEQSQQKP